MAANAEALRTGRQRDLEPSPGEIRFARIRATVGWLVEGHTEDEIRGLIARASAEGDDGWSMMPSAVDSLLAEAREVLTAGADVNPRTQLGLALFRLDELYRHSFGAADYKTALAATKERAALLRLTEVAPTVDPPDSE